MYLPRIVSHALCPLHSLTPVEIWSKWCYTGLQGVGERTGECAAALEANKYCYSIQVQDYF